MIKSAIHNTNDQNQGPGYVFLGTANASYDQTNLTTIGTIDENGIRVSPADDVFKHNDASGRVTKTEVIGQSCTVELTIMEVNNDTLDKTLGHGSWSTTASGSGNFTNQKIVLYGNNYAKLPGMKNVTITAADDGAATPVSYTVADDLEYDNSNTAANNAGFIRRKSTGAITSSAYGTTIYVDGSYTYNDRRYWECRAATDLDYFGLMVEKPNSEGNLDLYIFPKVQRVSAIEPLEMKNGEPYRIKVTFEAIQDPAYEYLYKIDHERAS